MGFELLFVRHGETVNNVQGHIQGHIDSDLTPHGQNQATALAKALQVYQPTALYSSDLGRAEATAAILGQHLDLTPLSDRRLREVAFGEAEGKTWAELQELAPEFCHDWYHHVAGTVYPGGESRCQVMERVLAFMEACVQLHGDTGRVIAVAHGGLLAALFCHILGFPSGRKPAISVANTSLNILRHSGKAWKIVSWNNITHLHTLKAEL